MTRKWFFEFLTHKNYPWAFESHRNVFYSSQGTRWTLKFCSSAIRSKVIGDHGFRHFSALDLTSEVTGWPRTLSLYINLFVSRRATRSFFPRSSSSIRGETARGGRTNPPLCRGRMRNGLCRRGLNGIFDAGAGVGLIWILGPSLFLAFRFSYTYLPRSCVKLDLRWPEGFVNITPRRHRSFRVLPRRKAAVGMNALCRFVPDWLRIHQM